MSNGVNPADINIRSPHYAIAQTRGRCLTCGELTRSLALVMPPGHAALSLDDTASEDLTGHQALGRDPVPSADAVDAHDALCLDDPPNADAARGHDALCLDDAPRVDRARDVWDEASCLALLFYVAYLPDRVQQRLRSISSFYRLTAGEAGDPDAGAGGYWANHCEHCGEVQSDHELFCEPGGAFLPTTDEAARAIRLLPVDEAFAAVAAGYAMQPQFLEWLYGA